MPLHCDNSVTKRSRTYDSSWHYSLEVIALFIIALLNDNDVFAYIYIYISLRTHNNFLQMFGK